MGVSRRSRVLAASAAVVGAIVGVVVTRRAVCEEPQEPIVLDYTSSPVCPDRASFEGRIRARTSHALFVSPPAATSGGNTEASPSRAFEVGLRGGARALGRLVIRRAGAVEGTREVEAETCSDVADALALAVSLAIDPAALMAASPAPPSPSASISASVSPSASTSAQPVASASAVQSPPESSAPNSSASPASPAAPEVPLATRPHRSSHSGRPSAWSLGVELAVASGVTADAVTGVSPSLGWRSTTPSLLAPSLRLAFLRTSNESVLSAGSASFTWTVGRADAGVVSWPKGTLGAVGGVRVEAGLVDALGSAIVGAQGSTRGWAALGPFLRGEWDLLSVLFASVDAAAMAHLTRDRFYFKPDATVWRAAWLGVEAGAGVGVRFF
jgi:hypothetical protein